MKHVIAILCTLVSVSALAESSVECSVKGGSEQALALAPKKFQINEAGEVSVYINGKFKLSVDFSPEVGYYGTHDFSVLLGATKTLITGEKINGTEKLSIVGCKNEESTTGAYSFSYEKGSKTKTVGSATYECECSMD